MYTFCEGMHVSGEKLLKMDHISHLILKKLNQQLSPEEELELQQWASETPVRRELLERLTNPDHLGEAYAQSRKIDWERPAEDMQRRISGMKRKKFIRRFTSVAAALLVVVFIAAAWLLIPDLSKKSDDVEKMAGLISIESLTPGKTGAIYRGSNGRTMMLSASDTTTIANQIEIDKVPAKDGKSLNLSLEVGRGREFKIVLEDSTVVWLNSESTLCYPERFAADSRRVTVTGEAYFEVKPDKNRPFIVESGGQNIKVYGTTFNVRGYCDEDAILTTLETGKISISDCCKPDAEVVLSPGHQARFIKSSAEVKMREVNPEIVTGWRHGKFVFEETPLSTIMRDLSRWYDFCYEFEDDALQDIVFMGSVSRYSDFRTIISILEDGGEVKFSINNNKVLISRKAPEKPTRK